MKPPDSTPSSTGFNRRAFLGALGAAALLPAGAGRATPPGNAATAAPFSELEEATIEDLQAALTRGETSARELTVGYLDRIAAMDRRGPELRSVLVVNPEALRIAEDLDRERRASGARGPLHGIPILIKDNVETKDRMPTTAGSLALAESFATRDAFVVERLRAAGAVILGKTNLSEWANIRSTRSSSGWSALGGQTRNPCALNRNASGSSSGSGAAAAASLCAAAVGTETDGSIVSPATHCGLVGFKPTVGLLSRSGIVPISHSQDTPGPMARTVRDAALLLEAMAGEDPRCAATAGTNGRARDLVGVLTPGGLRGVRLGVARAFFGFDERVDALMEAALQEMKRQGAELVDPVDLAKDSDYGEAEFTVLLYEFKHDLNAYLAGLNAKVKTRTLADLIAFNEQNKEREMPWFGQEIFLQAQEKGGLDSLEYQEARLRCLRLAREEGVDAMVKKHRLDAIVAPTGGPAWVIDLVNGDHYGGSCSSPPAVAGYPHITVPAGDVAGLPVGISFFGSAWSEATLLKIAYAFEQATHHRRAPRYLPSV